ncbi:MAG: tetratricopeptide repeat protein [Opitutae bacterium]|nr:tetratricopeptide repeat protein [Opitutae bacterium]
MKTQRSLPAALAALVLLATSALAQSPVELAAAALKKGDLAAAEALLTPLTAGEKPDPAALNQLSAVRLAQKKSKEAIELADKAVKLDATKADYFAQLGLAYAARMGELSFMQQAFVSGKLKKAFEKAVELDPNHLAGLIGLSRFYAGAPEIAGGSLEKAKELAERVRKLNPFLGEMELGRVTERGEDFDGALTHYEAAAKLKPDHAGAALNCGRMLAKLGKKDEARTRYEAALKLNPNLEAATKALAELDSPAVQKG